MKVTQSTTALLNQMLDSTTADTTALGRNGLRRSQLISNIDKKIFVEEIDDLEMDEYEKIVHQ